MKFILMFLFLFASVVNAEDAKTVQKDTRIYQVNKYGQTQYQKPSYKVVGDKVYQVNKYGQTQYQKGSLIIKSGSTKSSK